MTLPHQVAITGELHLRGEPCTFDQLVNGSLRGWESPAEVEKIREQVKLTLDELAKIGRIQTNGQLWSKYPIPEGYTVAAKPKTEPLEIPCEFGGVSLGDSTCRLGIRITRDSLSLTKADQFLCGRRIGGTIILSGRKDSPGQKKMFDSSLSIRGVFDVKRIGVSPGEISCGLTFSKADVDVATLSNFAKGQGLIRIANVEELPTGDEPSEDDDGDEE